MRDLKKRYESGENTERDRLYDRVEGGRIALTTDSWTGANKCDYTAVTADGKTKIGEMWSTLIDIIELTDPVYDGHYLCTKLLEVTNRLGITCAIISITRDNESPNDTMGTYIRAGEAVLLLQV
jgi:hypothetical protein